jgi:hypothetical protein
MRENMKYLFRKYGNQYGGSSKKLKLEQQGLGHGSSGRVLSWHG